MYQFILAPYCSSHAHAEHVASRHLHPPTKHDTGRPKRNFLKHLLD